MSEVIDRKIDEVKESLMCVELAAIRDDWVEVSEIFDEFYNRVKDLKSNIALGVEGQRATSYLTDTY